MRAHCIRGASRSPGAENSGLYAGKIFGEHSPIYQLFQPRPCARGGARACRKPKMHQSEGQEPVAGASPYARPPSYLARTLTLALLLVPLGLLIAASKFFETFKALYGPPYRSEIPAGMRALMAALAGTAGLMGIFLPFAGLFKSLQVGSRFEAGDYAVAESSSRRAANYSKQGIIFLIALLLILFADIFRYLTD